MIEIHGENGKVGEVSLNGGKVAGSTPAVHDVVTHMLRKHGTPQKAFRALATLNNGYVWAQNPVGVQQHATAQGEAARVIALTGDANHIHIPGSPYEWEHGYVPISEAAARSHFGGKVPKGWSAPSGGGKKAASAAGPPSLKSLAAKHDLRVMEDGQGGIMLLPKGGGIVSPVLKERDGQITATNGEEVSPHEADAYLAMYKQHPKALSAGLLYQVRSAASDGSETGKAGSGSAHAAAARKTADNVRFEPGLTRGQKEEAEQRLYKAAKHLDAGNHAEAASELDATMHATSLHGGGIIKGSTAAQARDLRDKVRAGNAPAGVLSGSHPADRLTVASDPKATARAMSDADLQRADVEMSYRATLLGKAGQMSRAHKAAVAEMQRRSVSMSVTWDDVLNVLEFSAKTAALEVTPALYGKPGGPGLYGVAGQKHSDYFEQLVKAFTEKRGMDKAGASRMAWGALRRWAAGGGHVTPEVRAAASKALAEEEGKAHAHAASWDQVARDIELSTVIELFNPAQPRVAAGTATAGQFAPAGTQPAAQPAAAKQTPAQKAAAAAAAKAKAAHAAHVAHVAHVNGVSSKKAELQVTAQDDRQKAAGLIKQRDALEKALQSASGKTNSGQAGSTTSANATTSSSAPATTASTAPASTTAASTTSSTAPAASTASASTASAGSAAAIKAQIGQLNTQINQLLAQAKQAETQAATMK